MGRERQSMVFFWSGCLAGFLESTELTQPGLLQRSLTSSKMSLPQLCTHPWTSSVPWGICTGPCPSCQPSPVLWHLNSVGWLRNTMPCPAHGTEGLGPHIYSDVLLSCPLTLCRGALPAGSAHRCFLQLCDVCPLLPGHHAVAHCQGRASHLALGWWWKGEEPGGLSDYCDQLRDVPGKLAWY